MRSVPLCPPFLPSSACSIMSKMPGDSQDKSQDQESTPMVEVDYRDDPVVKILLNLYEEQTKSMPDDKKLEEGLQLVKNYQRRLQVKDEVRTPSFFFGNLNFGLTGFLLGAFPEHFWVWQLCKCSFLLSLIVKRRKPRDYSLFEFCWIMNFASVGMGLALAVAPYFPAVHDLVNLPFTSLAIFAIANGPLAWSVVVFRNAFVMHDWFNTACLFIHISPPVCTWTFRWYHARVLAAYPQRVTLPLNEYADAVTFLDIVVPGALVYCTWMVLYTTLQFIWDDFCCLSTASKGALPIMLPMPGAKSSNRLRALQYNLTQFLLALLCISCTVLMWHSFYIHTGFLLFIILYAIYIGAYKIRRSTVRWYLKPFDALENAKRRDRN